MRNYGDRMLLIIVVNVLALVLLGPAWWFYRNEGAVLVSWRRTVFVGAFVANAVSAAVLLSFVIHAYMAVSGRATPVDLDRTYPVVSMLLMGILAAGLAGFGARVSRLILIVDGLLTAALWYLAAMGASP
jgi:hypothetical protein